MDRRSFLKSVAGAVAVSAAGTSDVSKPAESTPELHDTLSKHSPAAPIVFDPEILDIIELESPAHGELPDIARDGFEGTPVDDMEVFF